MSFEDQLSNILNEAEAKPIAVYKGYELWRPNEAPEFDLPMDWDDEQPEPEFIFLKSDGHERILVNTPQEEILRGLVAGKPDIAYSIAFSYGRYKSLEDIIKTDPQWAYYYALNIVEGRWPEGEAAIKTSAEWAYFYALNIVKGRWLEGEAAIKADATVLHRLSRNLPNIWDDYRRFFHIS